MTRKIEIEKIMPDYIKEHTIEKPLLFLMEAELVEEPHKYSIDYVGTDGTFTICDNMTKEDGEFMAVAIMTTKQYLRAKRFEVTGEFVEKVDAIVNKGHYLNWYEQDLGSVVKAALMAMWEEVENE